MKVCPNCRNKTEDEAKFCSECGFSFPDESDTSASMQPQKPKASVPKKSEKINQKWKWQPCPVGALVLGAVTIIYWILSDSRDVEFFKSYFKEIKPMLWFVIHARLLGGILISALGVICIITLRSTIKIINAIVLLLVGAGVIIIDLLAIPALRQYGENVDIATILNDLSVVWIIVGICHIGGGIFCIVTATKNE